MKIRDLPVHDLILDPRLNLRDELNQDTVERYMEAWDRLPPVTVYSVDGQLMLADGIHRHAAAVVLGKKTIKGEIIEGTFDEALDYVAGANLHHGLPLTRAERRRAIEVKLRLHHERSDRHLAEELCVGRELVAKIRRQLVESSQIPFGEVRVGADGKKYPALAKDPNERRPRSNIDAGAEPEARPRNQEDGWGDGAPGAPVGKKPRPPWEESPADARAIAEAPPIAPSAPTIDEMLQVMARQVQECVNWTNTDGFVDNYREASANARGLFQSAVIKLAARADQLRRVS